jgi:hypothetical protein
MPTTAIALAKVVKGKVARGRLDDKTKRTPLFIQFLRMLIAL